LRYEAARACGELESVSAIPQLAELLADQDREVQEASIWALGQIGGQKARQILEAHYETVDRGDDALREATEEALSELALASGAVQFPLYEYGVDTDGETGGWAEDWLDGVLDSGADEAALEDLNDD
jgi:HEAT repeat protein